MGYREDLLDKTMLKLYEAGIKEDCIGVIKDAFVNVLVDYEVSPRSTEVAIVDNENVKIAKAFLATKRIEGGSEETAKTRWYVIKMFDNDIGKRFSDVTKIDVLYWLASLQDRVSL